MAHDVNFLTERIISAAIEVHRALGPGLLESAYRTFLSTELRLRGLKVEREVEVPVTYRGQRLDCGYRMDLRVERLVVVELKAVERLHPAHTAQLLTYLRLSGAPVGLLLNFNAPVLKDGIRRVMCGRTVPPLSGRTE